MEESPLSIEDRLSRLRSLGFLPVPKKSTPAPPPKRDRRPEKDPGQRREPAEKRLRVLEANFKAVAADNQRLKLRVASLEQQLDESEERAHALNRSLQAQRAAALDFAIRARSVHPDASAPAN